MRSRLVDVPSRARAGALLFGLLFGLPALLFALGMVLIGLGIEIVGALFLGLSLLVFLGGTITASVLIFQARGRLQRAERALWAGDLDTATREARFVIGSVFRADYQLGALYTLALAAERMGAFPEAGELFGRALEMVPAFAATRPGRRVRALATAHAALSFAACGDLARAQSSLASCHAILGNPGQPSAFEALFDDSGMGAIGVNTMLVEVENRREPRPLAVLASALVLFRAGRHHEVAGLLDVEQQSVMHGLGAHERALAMRLRADALRLLPHGPHRAPGVLAVDTPEGPDGWATLVLGPPR